MSAAAQRASPGTGIAYSGRAEHLGFGYVEARPVPQLVEWASADFLKIRTSEQLCTDCEGRVLYNRNPFDRMYIRCSAVISLGLVSSLASAAQDPEEHTIKSNLLYRLTRGDLPKLSFGIEKPKNVEVIGGGEDLLQSCLNDPAKWSKDPLMFRLAHSHAGTIQSCRENSSPSMHVIFRKVPDEPLHAWAHLDGHGSQTSKSRMMHLGEFIYHKITLRNNDQERMFGNLQHSLASPPQALEDPAIPFTGRQRFNLFTTKTLTRLQPYATSVVSSATSQLFNPSDVWGQGTDRFTNHLVASFTQRLVTYGVQGAAAAALHQDLRYKPSQSRNVWRRTGHALVSTLVLETPHGNDIAFANIVAAVGSGIIIHTYHPGREDFAQPGTWNQAGLNLWGFAQSNLWNEFKPDLKHLIRSKLLHRK